MQKESVASRRGMTVWRGFSSPTCFFPRSSSRLSGAQAGSPCLGAGAMFYLAAGEHTFEVKYNMESLEKKIKERRITALVVA